MNQDLTKLLTSHLDEVMAHRFGFKMPPLHASPTEVHESLLDVRNRLDRVEQKLGEVIRIKGVAGRYLAAATARVEDAWDEVVTEARKKPVARGDEYSSAKERHAEANLAVFDKRRAQRAAQDLYSKAEEKTDLIRLAHRGLADTRHELLTILRAVQFESSMDR